MASQPDDSQAIQQLPDDKRKMLNRMGVMLEEGRLPFFIFNDQDIFDLEMKHIFGENWIFVGHESEIPEPGDYARRYIGKDPFIFIRNEDGGVQVLFDSCRHRGTKIARADEGNASHFRCPYHGWTYNNKGQLIGIPEKEKAYCEIDTEEWKLAEPADVDSYQGMVFATLSDDSPSLKEYLGDMTWHIDAILGFAEGWEVIGTPSRYVVDNDWKSGVENFGGDDYHLAATHQTALEQEHMHVNWIRGSDEAAGLAERAHVHFEDLPEMGHSISHGLIDEDMDSYYGYPDELRGDFNADAINEDQWEVARRGVVGVGSIFPNLSILQIALGNGVKQAGFFNLKLWQPKEPGQMELWNWFLVPKGADEEYKQLAHDVAMGTFSPSGTWEQDDMAVWDGVAESAGTVFAKKNEVTTNYLMGMGDMSDTEEYEEFPAPGHVYTNYYQEGYARSLHKRWHHEIANGS